MWGKAIKAEINKKLLFSLSLIFYRF